MVPFLTLLYWFKALHVRSHPSHAVCAYVALPAPLFHCIPLFSSTVKPQISLVASELGVEGHLQDTVKKGNQEVVTRLREEGSVSSIKRGLAEPGSALFRVIEAPGQAV